MVDVNCLKKMIYRITNIKDWQAAQITGYFESADLKFEPTFRTLTGT